jgi:phosphoethanolamine N-methyltransferase
MTTTGTATGANASYDNNGQYSRVGILRYEKIFGRGYVSTGGPETTDYLCEKLGPALKPGVRVLDVGSGIGGAAIHLAKTYGASVTGIDLSPEMIEIARERCREEGAPESVTSLLGDILETPLEGPFDVAWSRDALMHIPHPQKPRLYARIHELLRPGGQLVITDYARGAGDVSDEFLAYAEKTGYHLVDPASYGFVDILERESERLAANREDFLSAFREEDLDYLLDRWAMKVRFCRAGDMRWGIYQATR